MVRSDVLCYICVTCINKMFIRREVREIEMEKKAYFIHVKETCNVYEIKILCQIYMYTYTCSRVVRTFNHKLYAVGYSGHPYFILKLSKKLGFHSCT
jgi:hypothetical protein